MLSKLTLIVWLSILLVFSFFAGMNSNPVVVNLFPGYQTIPIPLFVVIIISVIVGVILAISYAIGDWIRFKVENSKLSSQLQQCLEEKERLEKELRK